ncbi:MAG TPA: Ada metal-binding domain-containing protein, partial [Opitutaceae bacterium]|nr:Ada metal-binding domain-containing protein [Opitutaceae bacterium]
MRTNPDFSTGPPPLDPDLCWRAWVRRDRRFEGRFYMGVTSTGIYCRPGCPARLPARRNVLFFRSAAAAESDGFRPCHRCRPDSLPGSAAAAGTSAIVSRALRLIESGALDEGSLDTLAARLGVTSRWLRELFVRQIGAAPLAVAQTRRAHLARRLVESSAMPLEDVAAAAGYGSARRLRHALQRSFGRSARTLRARRAGTRPAALTLHLTARGAFDPTPAFAFLLPRAIPGMEIATPATWRRAVRIESGAAIVEVSADPERGGLRLRIQPPAPRAVPGIVARVSRVFDLGADVAGIAAELRADPFLRARMPAAGIRITGAWDAFEMGVRAIVGQQISVAAARTLLGRIVERCGERLPFADESLTHLFPTPVALAACDL